MTPSAPTAFPSPAPRRKWLRNVVASALVAGAVWLGWSQLFKGKASKNDVLFAVATRGDLVISVTEQGELQSRDAQPIISEVGGRETKITNILPEGTVVKKGDEVVWIDNDEIQKLVAAQEVKVESADGKLKAARGALEVAKNKAEGDVAKAQLELTLAKLDYDSYEEGEYQVELDKRNSKLELSRKELTEAEDSLKFTRDMVKKGFTPTEQLRQLELGVQAKVFSVREGEADLKVFQKFTKLRKFTELKAKAEDAVRNLDRAKQTGDGEIDKAKAEVASGERTLKLEDLELKRLKRQLDLCIIKAPTAGIVVYDNSRPWDPNSKIRPGAMIYAQRPIFTLPDLSKMIVKVKVHESVVKKVRKGQDVSMIAQSLPNQILRGKVLSVATFADGDEWRGSSAIKQFIVEVSVDNLPMDAGLKPGMTAEVRIAIVTIPGTVVIPVNGVTEINGERVCYVVTPGGTERRGVTVGEGNEQNISVTSGLAEGEKVALDARTRGLAEIKLQNGGRNERKENTEKVETPTAPTPSSAAPQ